MPRLSTLAFALATVLVVTATPGHAQIYVDKSASGNNDGSSWTDAYTDLQDAIDDAGGSDEIWIAEGVYVPGTDERDSFRITGTENGLELYGGFAGTESYRWERAPEVYQTILSGDLGGDDTDPDGNGIVEDSADVNGDNAYHVLLLDGTTGGTITSATVIEGIVVTAGQADGSGLNGNAGGGGLFCDGSDSGKECSPILQDVVFAGNVADERGGAIYNDGGAGGTASPIIRDATFRGNAATVTGSSSEGGAICNRESSPTITSAVFTGNRASGGGAIANVESGVGADVTSPHIEDVTFVDNTASEGGAILTEVSLDGTGSPTIINATFVDNAAVIGGGVHTDGGNSGVDITIASAVFTGNEADSIGGAIYNEGANSGDDPPETPTIANVTFTNNAADHHGGAIYNIDSTPDVVNTILWANESDADGSGSGTGDEMFTHQERTPLVITHSIIEGGVDGNGLSGRDHPFIDHDIIYEDGGGNLDDAPQFVDASTPGGPDGVHGTRDDGLNVQGNSPAIDAGDVDAGPVPADLTVDVTGADRVQDRDGDLTERINIGAYEVAIPDRPEAVTEVPSRVRSHSADLSGTVNPSGAKTTVEFEYRETGASSFESIPAAESPLPAGVEDQPVRAEVTGLDLDTEYEVRVVAINDEGTDGGEITVFTTDPWTIPTVQTDSVTNVGGTTAKVGGTVNPNDVETTIYAEVAPASNPADTQTFADSDGPLTGDGFQDVAVSLDGLVPNTTYKASIVASTAEGAEEAASITFTTTDDGYARRVEGTDGTGNDAGWRMLALPAAGKTRAALEGDLTFATNSGSILYRWLSGSWAAQTNGGDALPRGKGFMLYFFDDVIDPIDAEGLPLAVGTGSEDHSQNLTVESLSTSEIFHLVGNPFDTAFDLSELNLSAQGFQTTVQIWDPSSRSYTSITQQGDDSDVIGAWQGFFVERDPNADTDGQTLTFSTAGKQSGPGTIIGSQSATLVAKRSEGKRLRLDLRLAAVDTSGSDTAPPSPSAKMSLTRPLAALDTIEGSAGKTQTDAQSEADTIATGRLAMLLSERASAGWDEAEATQVGPPGSGAAVTLSSPLTRNGSDGNVLVQRALASEPYPTEERAATIPVAAAVPVESYAAGAEARIGLPEARRSELSRRLPAGWALRLTDTQTGEHTDLLTETYSFTLEEGAGTGLESPSDARFRLAVGPREALPVTEGLSLKPPYPNPATRRVTVEYAMPQKKAAGAQLELYDVLGRRVRTSEVKAGPRAQQLGLRGLASGTYFLRLRGEGAQQTRKLTIVR